MMTSRAPARVEVMCALMQRQWSHLVRLHDAGLGLQSWRDVGEHVAVLTFDRANLELEARCIRLASVRRQKKVSFLKMKQLTFNTRSK